MPFSKVKTEGPKRVFRIINPKESNLVPIKIMKKKNLFNLFPYLLFSPEDLIREYNL